MTLTFMSLSEIPHPVIRVETATARAHPTIRPPDTAVVLIPSLSLASIFIDPGPFPIVGFRTSAIPAFAPLPALRSQRPLHLRMLADCLVRGLLLFARNRVERHPRRHVVARARPAAPMAPTAPCAIWRWA